MRVVLYWENSAEERAAKGLLGPLSARITGLVNGIIQGNGRGVVVTARPLIENDNPEMRSYMETLERTVFGLNA